MNLVLNALRIVVTASLLVIYAEPAFAQGDLNAEEQKIYEEMKKGGLPPDFDKLEIESKWEATEKQYRQMLEAFQHGEKFMGYEVRIRWNGIPKVFIDTYFDTPEGDLEKAGEVLRARERRTLLRRKQLVKEGHIEKGWVYKGDPLDIKKVVGSNARGLWIREWGRVQYKEKAHLRGAAWFRYEVGDKLVWRNENYEKDFVPPRDLQEAILKGDVSLEAIDLLLKNHGPEVVSRLRPKLRVTDIRYRAEFWNEGPNARAVYEQSIDRLETEYFDRKTNRFEVAYEGELEILPVTREQGTKGITPKLIDNLYIFSARIQNMFDMKPSTRSKGGVLANGTGGQCKSNDAGAQMNMN